MRHIIHADLDAFYAAVEQLDNPELVGKPVLVGGRPENRGGCCHCVLRSPGVRRALGDAHAHRRSPLSSGDNRPAKIQPLQGKNLKRS